MAKNDSEYTKIDVDSRIGVGRSPNGTRNKNRKDAPISAPVVPVQKHAERPREVGPVINPFPVGNYSFVGNLLLAYHHLVLAFGYARTACYCAVGFKRSNRSSDLFYLAHPHANVHAVPDDNAHLDGNAHADQHAITHEHVHAKPHTIPDCNVDSKPDANAHDDTNSHTNANAECKRDSVSDSGTSDDNGITGDSTKKNATNIASVVFSNGCDNCGDSACGCGNCAQVERGRSSSNTGRSAVT